MKLSQYKEKKKNKKIIIVFVAIIFLIGGVAIGITFANFKTQKSFKVIEGNFIYEGKGDIIFAFYKDNKQVNEIPKEEEFYDFEKGICTNNATVVWNSKIKKALISDLTTTGTKCDLYFVKNQSKEYFGNLQKSKPTELVYDGTSDNNLRFIGANPNNYVAFNNETWRIIGVMNNIEDEENEILKSHIKIIRDSIGEYSWDSTSGTYPNGINEWSTSAISKVLNENFYQKKAGGTCYSGENKYVKECPKWESIGLNDDARAMVSKIKWNTGTTPVDIYLNQDLGTPTYMYEMERSDNDGHLCDSSASNCSSVRERTTNWTGYVGLMYPSDYGFATSGGGETKRQKCLTTGMYKWYSGTNQTNCAKNSWLYGNSSWTITPSPHDQYDNHVFYIYDSGLVNGSASASSPYAIRPVVYLNSNIKIEEDESEDYGSSTNPFRLVV